MAPRHVRRTAPLLAAAVVAGGAFSGVSLLDRETPAEVPAVAQAPTQVPTPTPTADPGEPTTSEAPTRTRSPLRRARGAILRRTNLARESEGLAPLRLKRPMNRVAQRWTKQMAATSSMSHNPVVGDQIPDGWTTWAENVAYGYTPVSVVGAWMDSPGHRENILRDVTHLGVGVARSGDGTRYFTQVFARY